MSIIKFCLAFLWGLASLALVTVWIWTLVQTGVSAWLPATAYLVIIPLLAAVEGLELSVTALLGRSDPELTESATAELHRIKSDPKLPFIPNRQVFVVMGIVILTMASSFNRICLPAVGCTSDIVLLSLFNLAFSTLAVLLLAQVPGNLLALYWPERFFAQTWCICILVRWVGSLEVTKPALTLTWLLAKLLGYPVRHTLQAPRCVLVYPVFDYIESEWYYEWFEMESTTDPQPAI